MTPDVIYDQMIAAGVARKLVFSWLGNPGVGSLHAIRRRIDERLRADVYQEESLTAAGPACLREAGGV